MKTRVPGFGSVVTSFILLGVVAPLRAALDSPVIEPPEVTRSYADSGDPTAQFNLALQAARADQPNLVEAVAWYRKAAAAGFPPAQYNLGILLGRGEGGVAKDEKEAVKWFYEAGRQGLFEAQKALIECYSKGLGVPTNPATALTWDFLARRSLELRHEQPAGEPPKPPKLRPDGFAEITSADGKVEAIGPDGTIETIGSDGRKVRKRPDGSTTTVSATGGTQTIHKDGRTVTENPNGQKQTRLANGMVLTEFPDGRKEYKAPGGGSRLEYPDGRTVETDRAGTIERKFPDGTREVEGAATLTSGKPVRGITKYDKAGQQVSQRIIDGLETIEPLPDGSTNIETIGHDEQGREVRVINNYTAAGTRGQRKLIRVADGVERTGEEFWVIKRWVYTPDGKMALMKEKYGLGNSTYDEEVLETKDRPRLPSMPPPAIARGGPFVTPARTPSPMPSGPPGGGVVVFQEVPRTTGIENRSIGGTGNPIPIYRQKIPITAQLEELAKLERDARNFAGATEQDYEKARATAKGYVFNLAQSPQKPQSGNWLNQRITLNAAPPPPPPLRELPSDRSDVHPLGLYGRTLIKENRWKHAETDHFVVHYMEAADAYPVMRFIECAYFFVTQTLMIDDSKSKRKSHVFVFPDTGTWTVFTSSKGMSPAVAGFAYKDELLLGAHDEKDTYLKVLCHEATHAIVARFYAGRKWPLWLNEGFADYMAAKTISLRRSHKIERYLAANPGKVDVNGVFNRIRYGDTTSAAGTSEVVSFYHQSEKCVRTLLEKLPPGGFPKFANLVFAGNSLPISLREAYLDACPDLTKFENLVNAP